MVNASKHADSLIGFATSRKFGFSTWDQGALEKHFGGTTAHPWDWLDDSVINSRGFLPTHQFMDRGTGRSRAAIWHWHGYKANQIACLFRAIHAGTWNITGGGEKGPDPKLKETQVPGCEVVTGNGKFPLALHTCYLATYAWMLNQVGRRGAPGGGGHRALISTILTHISTSGCRQWSGRWSYKASPSTF